MAKENLVVGTFKAMRPVHWIKNLSLFAAIFLSGTMFYKGEFVRVVWAFVAFCLITSATYIINDILDIKADRLHPTKKFRPVASGSLPVSVALIEAIVLAFSSFFIASLGGLNSLFITVVIIYLVMQLLYSLGLKNIAILDIVIIAAGFVLLFGVTIGLGHKEMRAACGRENANMNKVECKKSTSRAAAVGHCVREVEELLLAPIK